MRTDPPLASRSPIVVNPGTLDDPTRNGYSTAVVAPAGCRLAFISGQGGHDAAGRLSTDFVAQVSQAYANLALALDALGASPDRVVRLATFVVDHDMTKLGILTRAVTQMFGGALPAQTLVPVARLAVDGMMFEVEATVALE